MIDPNYGNRETFSPGQTVTRPDGSTFVQGFLGSYSSVTLPEVGPPPGRTSRIDGIRRRHDRAGGRYNGMSISLFAGMTIVMDSAFWEAPAVAQAFGPTFLHESGKYYLRELLQPGLPEGTPKTYLRRLRSSKEGNG